MAILVEGTMVVITTSSLEGRFPGGAAAFAKQCPNSTYRSDGVLSGVSFMVPADAQRFARALTKHGFVDPSTAATGEVAVVDQSAGVLTKCDWLNVDLKMFRTAEGTAFGATVAWKEGADSTTFAAPSGWRPHSMVQIALSDLEQNYELVSTAEDPSGGGAVLGYKHRESGKIVYIGRPAIVSDDPEDRCADLFRAIAPLMSMPASSERSKIVADLCERAADLVAQTNGAQRGPLYAQGLAARLAGRWRIAEGAFRRVTELCPDDYEAWLELTWALGSLDRADEAVAAARRGVELRPDRCATHSNLAGALLQSGRADEALAAVARALELDPADAIAQGIRQRAQAGVQERPALEEHPAAESARRPWYARWFR